LHAYPACVCGYRAYIYVTIELNQSVSCFDLLGSVQSSHTLETGGGVGRGFSNWAENGRSYRLPLENIFFKLTVTVTIPIWCGMLTEKEKAFVQAIADTGGGNKADCARIAGFSPGRARQTAHELMRNPKILEAIVEHTKLNIAEFMPMIAHNLIGIALDPDSKSAAKVGLQMLAMFGISPVTKTESKKTVEHTTNLGALEELKLLAAQLRGLPAPKMIDATPEEEEWSAYG